jgi:hypothetical protein
VLMNILLKMYMKGMIFECMLQVEDKIEKAKIDDVKGIH